MRQMLRIWRPLQVGARHQLLSAKPVPSVGFAPKSCFECGSFFASKSGSLLASAEGKSHIRELFDDFLEWALDQTRKTGTAVVK